MKVTDLTPAQLTQAKGAMVMDSLNRGETRYQEIDVTFPDDVITDAEAYAYYANTEFAEEDFASPEGDDDGDADIEAFLREENELKEKLEGLKEALDMDTILREILAYFPHEEMRKCLTRIWEDYDLDPFEDPEGNDDTEQP